jgi:hypothetical protein
MAVFVIVTKMTLNPCCRSDVALWLNLLKISQIICEQLEIMTQLSKRRSRDRIYSKKRFVQISTKHDLAFVSSNYTYISVSNLSDWISDLIIEKTMNHRIFEITSKLKSILNHIQVRNIIRMTTKFKSSQSNATNAIKSEAEKFEKIVYSSFAAYSMIV